jgi:hypothetical protein
MLAVLAVCTTGVTLIAQKRGACGAGDLRPTCAMYAAGLNVYAMIAVLAVTVVATVAMYARRKRPPVQFQAASILSVAAACAYVLPVRAAGNKQAGAIVVTLMAPVVFTLLAFASFCVFYWLVRVASEWIEGRAGAGAGLSRKAAL